MVILKGFPCGRLYVKELNKDVEYHDLCKFNDVVSLLTVKDLCIDFQFRRITMKIQSTYYEIR